MGRRRTDPGRRPVPAPLVLAAAYLAGAVPFSGLAARWRAGTDLRDVDNGTVSGTGLYTVAGFGPLAVAGSLDVAKGALGPLLAGRERPYLAAAAGSLAVAGHNWSPFLGGAGGRGISPSLGALGILAPEGTATLLGGLAGGRLLKRTALVSLFALLVLGPLLAVRRGRAGLAAWAGVATPMLAKRLAGNRPGGRLSAAVLRERLLYDREPAA